LREVRILGNDGQVVLLRVGPKPGVSGARNLKPEGGKRKWKRDAKAPGRDSLSVGASPTRRCWCRAPPSFPAAGAASRSNFRVNIGQAQTGRAIGRGGLLQAGLSLECPHATQERARRFHRRSRHTQEQGNWLAFGRDNQFTLASGLQPLSNGLLPQITYGNCAHGGNLQRLRRGRKATSEPLR
jgi:hypothetical protein